MNKMIIVYLVVVTVGIFFLGTSTVLGDDNKIIELNEKIESLEKELAQKNQEYEWLKELQDYCLETGKLPDINLTPPWTKM